MRRSHALWCAAFAALLFDDVGPMPAPLPPPLPPPALPAVAPVSFTAVTFNAGLAPGMVPLANERAPAVAAAVAALPDDVLCLQELWRPEHERLVLAALGLPDAHVFRFDSAGLGVNPAERCEAGALDGLVACTERDCGAAEPEDQARCVAANCRSEMRSLYFRQRDCLDCSVSGAGKPLK